MGKSKNKVTHTTNPRHPGAPLPPVLPSSNKKNSPIKAAKKINQKRANLSNVKKAPPNGICYLGVYLGHNSEMKEILAKIG